MRVRTQRHWCKTSLFTLVALAALGRSSAVQAEDGKGIRGTWINEVTVDTPPGAPPLVLHELVAFNPGGTLVETISIAHGSENPFFSGPFAPLAVDLGDAFGSWKRQGDDGNRYAITFKRLLFAGAQTPAESYGDFFPGQYVGVATIQAVAVLEQGDDGSGDRLTGSFTFQLTNLARAVVLASL
ncbi:MAG: hypothetical protein NVS2B9_07610 [Myxococcales bacterium]